MTKIILKAFKAGSGDSFLINFQNKGINSNILVDTGICSTSRHIFKEIKKMRNQSEFLDLVILTHVDNDHIGGFIRLLEKYDIDNQDIKEIWINSGYALGLSKNEYIPINLDNSLESSIKSAKYLENLIIEKKIKLNKIPIKKGVVKEINSAMIKVISPNNEELEKLKKKWKIEDKDSLELSKYDDSLEEIDDLILKPFQCDKSIPNQSSIAFIFQINEKKILFLGDCVPLSVLPNLKEDNYHLVKLPHHGSRKNVNEGLLQKICCERFLISTNGAYHNHPDKECLARIVNHYSNKITLLYNYEITFNRKMFDEEDKSNYNFKLECIMDKSLIL